MIKFLPIVIIILAILGGFLYWRFSTKDALIESTSQIQITGDGLLEDRVATLERAVIDLIKSGREISSSSASLETDTITQLQNTVTSLQSQIDTLKQSGTALTSQTSTSQTTTTATQAPLFIPLGWIGSSKTTDWAAVTGQEISIDPADYPGYKNIYFEVSLRIFQNGKAYARLQNKDDGTAILSSEVSTTSTDYTWLTSSSFQLPGAKKTYRLQLKSLTGYSADVQNARIKIVF